MDRWMVVVEVQFLHVELLSFEYLVFFKNDFSFICTTTKYNYYSGGVFIKLESITKCATSLLCQVEVTYIPGKHRERLLSQIQQPIIMLLIYMSHFHYYLSA